MLSLLTQTATTIESLSTTTDKYGSPSGVWTVKASGVACEVVPNVTSSDILITMGGEYQVATHMIYFNVIDVAAGDRVTIDGIAYKILMAYDCRGHHMECRARSIT